MSARCVWWRVLSIVVHDVRMGETPRRCARALRAHTSLLSLRACAHAHLCSHSHRRPRAPKKDSSGGSDGATVNPHDVGSVLSHDKLMGEVRCPA